MKQAFILHGPKQRAAAVSAIATAPDGYAVQVSPATRTTDQNSKLWPMLADVSQQVDWYGRKLSPEDWKHVFTASLKKQDVVPGIDGGFVVLGMSTSNMSKRLVCDLIELIYAFGAEHGVHWSEPNPYEGQAA